MSPDRGFAAAARYVPVGCRKVVLPLRSGHLLFHHSIAWADSIETLRVHGVHLIARV